MRLRGLRSAACAAGVFAAVLAAYWPACRAGFIWDDDAHVTRAELRSAHGLWRIWFDLGATQQYYPVLHSAFWVEHGLWGDSALGYHMLNVLLHATAACLFALVLRRVLGRPGVSWTEWLAGALFALHPVCVESVAWVSEQKNTLSTVFCLLAALAFLRWRDQRVDAPEGEVPPRKDTSRSMVLYWIATALFVLAILTKSVTATAPAALLVVLWWREGRLNWKRDWLPLIPWLAMGAAAGLFTAWVERRYIGAQGAQFDLGWVERCLLAGRAACFYFGKLAWPARLIFIYPRWTIDAGAGWGWLYPAVALGVPAALALRGFRGALAGVLCFLGMLFPALGFFNVYPFVFSYVADHFQYLASLPVLALAAVGWERWRAAGSWRGRTAVPAAVVAVILFGALSWRQCGIYQRPARALRRHAGRKSGLLARARQSRRPSGAFREGRRGDRPLPRGAAAQAGLPGSATTISGTPWRNFRGACPMQSPNMRRLCGCTPASRRRITTWGMR